MKTSTLITAAALALLLAACGKSGPEQGGDKPAQRSDTLPTKTEKYWRELPELEIGADGKADLIPYGVPAKIQAPKGLKVIQMGKVVPSLTLRDKGNYWISVETQEFTRTFDRKKIKEQAMENVKKLKNFSKIVEEEEFGFIFELDFNGEKQYNFRYIVVADKLYHIFRTTVMRKISLEQAKTLYASVKNQ
jgi:hypothetical protein